MLKPAQIVINTSPIISLIAGLGDLEILQSLYTDVFVPFEVCHFSYQLSVISYQFSLDNRRSFSYSISFTAVFI